MALSPRGALFPGGDAIQANAARRLKLLIFDPNF